MPRSRRSLLTAAGLALGTGSLASLTGCVGRPSATDESRDEPSPSGPGRFATTDFTQWIPDPETTSMRDGVGIRYFDVEAIRDHRGAIHENAYDRLESEMLRRVSRYVDEEDVVASLEIGFTISIVLGSFDPEAIAEIIASEAPASNTTSTGTPADRPGARTPWPEPERYRGFDLYGPERVHAVSEDVVMSVHPFQDDAVAHAKAFIDAPTPETSQYEDGNEYVAAMLGLVDDPHALWCYPEAMDGSTSRGFRKDVITGGLKSWRFGSETTHFTYANTYPDTETAESGELAAFLEANQARFDPYDGLDVDVEGRMAWTDGTIPTSEFDHLSAGGPGDSVTTPN